MLISNTNGMIKNLPNLVQFSSTVIKHENVMHREKLHVPVIVQQKQTKNMYSVEKCQMRIYRYQNLKSQNDCSN